ncbi:MAG: transposase [Actinobacteria bacterium]|nr:transposase [Actinomycetota bacterium]
MGGRTGPPYPPEFRAEVVRLVRSGGTIKDVAADLGCSIESLRHWVGRPT